MKFGKIIKRVKCELMYRKAKAAALKASSNDVYWIYLTVS